MAEQPERMTRLEALRAELAAVRGAPVAADDEAELRRRAHEMDLSALCLSGGGIRSAAFNLGVLQALARHGMLKQFDYLSTVSGGGYIGSWLQRMIHERGSVRAAEEALGNADLPAEEVRRLRDYTNFLAPRGGALSADLWGDIVLYLRNVLINWSVYLPLFALAVLAAIFYRTLIFAVGHAWQAQFVFILAAAMALAVSTFHTARFLPDHQDDDAGACGAQPRAITRRVVWPALAWAGLAPLGLEGGHGVTPLALLPAYLLAQSIGYAAAWLSAKRGAARPELFWSNAVAFGAGTFVSGAWIALLFAFADWVAALAIDERAQLLAVIGPFWLLLALALHSTVFVGLRRDGAQFDLDREWLARISALKLRAGTIWLGFALAALSVPAVLQIAWTGTWPAPVVTLVAGPLGAWLGKQASSGGASVIGAISRSERMRVLGPALLAVLFILGLVASLALGIGAVLGLAQDCAGDALHFGKQAREWLPFLAQAFTLLALLGVLHWINRRVNVNRYSMHAVYRNRLMRAFLGAARGANRRPDPFTGFDPQDNLPLRWLLRDDAGPRPLFPLINLTLNLTAGATAAWAERKAMAFTATPLACGAPLLRPSHAPGAAHGPDRPGVYVPTQGYAGLENADTNPKRAHGLSLASAMAISGAAVSPNWGYHSSPVAAFVMTLFNVRLGAWLPNPAAVTSPRQLNFAFPPRSLRALGSDLLGLSDDAGPAIYLSDGGHFENLGVYEALRRRCRWILAIDAGQDGLCQFEDLGNALRKARIDMQIRIAFETPPRIVARGDAAGLKTATGFARATIHYPEPDGGTSTLLYLKPTLLPDCPQDVRAYANTSAAFPHEPTADQFFSESQFESYRALGEFQCLRLLPDDAPPALRALFNPPANG